MVAPTSFHQESLLPPLPVTERGKQTIIDSDLDGNRIVYAHGKSIYIVNLDDPSKNDCYTEHSYQCAVARFSPSGYYVASADVAGNVRIWDATQPEHVLKAEYRVLSGPIRDLCWDAESKHIIAVGEGRETFAAAFHFDTGSSLGEVIGHTKNINAVTIRPCRPLRAATASDDFTVMFYSGTPYKFSKTLKHHTRFVQSVRYAPDGSKFVSCGSDGKIFVYDGESGDMLHELKDGETSAHSSGVISVAWSPDSSKIGSISMDGTVKIWTMGSNLVEKSIEVNEIEGQLTGIVWNKKNVIITSLSGEYALLDAASFGIFAVVTGHQKGLSALTAIEDQLISASYDGKVCKWNQGKANNTVTEGPSNQVNDLKAFNHNLYAVSSLEDKAYVVQGESVSALPDLGGIRMAVCGDYLAILNKKAITIIDKSNKNVKSKSDFSSEPKSIAGHDSWLAVGFEDKSIQIYSVPSFDHIKTLTSNLGSIASLAFSQDGKLLAAGDSQRRIKVYNHVESPEALPTNWCFHNAEVNCLAWVGPDLLVSGSLDTNLMVWSTSSRIKPITTISNAHTGPIVGVVALPNGRFASASQDGSIRVWSQ